MKLHDAQTFQSSRDGTASYISVQSAISKKEKPKKGWAGSLSVETWCFISSMRTMKPEGGKRTKTIPRESLEA